MDADGKNPQALTTEKDAYVRSAAWTPDGHYVIARKEDGKRAGIPPVELWIYHREGGGGIKLTSSDDVNNAGGAVVSRDGESIYFSARQRKFSYTPNLADGLWQIWRYDRELAETFPVAGGFGGAVRPALSPDGKTLTFVSRRDDDTCPRRARPRLGIRADPRARRDARRDGGLRADGPLARLRVHARRQVARLLQQGQDRPPRRRLRAIREIPFTAQVEQSRSRPAWPGRRRSRRGRSGEDPALAEPVAGRRAIAFEAFGRVWLQDARGGKASGAPRRLTHDDASLPQREYAPTFSPDGKWIAYVSWSDAEGGHVWKAPARRARAGEAHEDRRATTPIRPGRRRATRSRSLRGSGLEFRGRQPEEEEFFEIVLLDAAGGELKPVVGSSSATRSSSTRRSSGTPTARASTTATRSSRRSRPTIPRTTSSRSGSTAPTARHLLRFPAVDDIVPSPDGQWVVFTSRDNVYVTALPGILTKEPPEVGLKEGAVPVYRLSDDAGGYVRWADGGKTITWALGNTFYRLPLADRARVRARPAPQGRGEGEEGGRREGRDGRRPTRRRTRRRRRSSRRRGSRRPRRSRSRSRCRAPRRRARSCCAARASSR